MNLLQESDSFCQSVSIRLKQELYKASIGRNRISPEKEIKNKGVPSKLMAEIRFPGGIVMIRARNSFCHYPLSERAVEY